jgi:hypothetical protein
MLPVESVNLMLVDFGLVEQLVLMSRKMPFLVERLIH